MHTVGVVALRDVIGFDLPPRVEVFSPWVLPSGEPGSGAGVAHAHLSVSAGPMRIATDHGSLVVDLDGGTRSSVPGRNDVTQARPMTYYVPESAYAGAPGSPLLLGASLFAEAGLPTARRATTPWLAADLSPRNRPRGDLTPTFLRRRGSALTFGGRVRPVWRPVAATWLPVTTALAVAA